MEKKGKRKIGEEISNIGFLERCGGCGRCWEGKERIETG